MREKPTHPSHREGAVVLSLVYNPAPSTKLAHGRPAWVDTSLCHRHLTQAADITAANQRVIQEAYRQNGVYQPLPR